MRKKVNNAPAVRQREGGQRNRSKYDGFYEDIRGQQFGRLIAVHATDMRDHKGSVVWACLCECKTVAYVTQDNLMSKTTQSCGCLKAECGESLRDHLHFVEGTCVEWIEKRKHRCDNTSGFRGVYKIRDNRWRACIGFKGKRHHIGYFKTFEEAKQARLHAESEIYAPFLEAYYDCAPTLKNGTEG